MEIHQFDVLTLVPHFKWIRHHESSTIPDKNRPTPAILVDIIAFTSEKPFITAGVHVILANGIDFISRTVPVADYEIQHVDTSEYTDEVVRGLIMTGLRFAHEPNVNTIMSLLAKMSSSSNNQST